MHVEYQCYRCRARTEFYTDGLSGRLYERVVGKCVCPKPTRVDLDTQFTDASTARVDRLCECGASLEGRHANTFLCLQCSSDKHSYEASRRIKAKRERRCMDCGCDISERNADAVRCGEHAQEAIRQTAAERKRRSRARKRAA